jgi:threonylcarbamoyladenosine tRNA methylthiotransferase MtaB
VAASENVSLSGPEILTFGCRLNTWESEVMRTHAQGLGEQAQGDVIIVNTCAVTGEAERQARQAIRRAHRRNPDARIVVTGCAAQIDPDRWAALPGVTRVLGNEEKLKAESWSPAAMAEPRAVSDIMAARGNGGASGDGICRAHARLRAGSAGV